MVLSLPLGACQIELPTTDSSNLSGDLEKLDPSGALVVYWHALTGAEEDSLLEMIDDFNTSNEWGISVVGEYQGDLETLYARVMAGLTTGRVPNLVMTDPSLSAAYTDQNAIVALSPYLDSKIWGFAQTELED